MTGTSFGARGSTVYFSTSAVVDPARVVCQVLVARHHVRGHAADGASLSGELEVAEIPVRRADVRDEDRVVEVEDVRHAREREPALEEGRAEQRGLPQDVDRVELARAPHVARATHQRLGGVPELLADVPLLVENVVQRLRLEGLVRYLDAALAEQRL